MGCRNPKKNEGIPLYFPYGVFPVKFRPFLFIKEEFCIGISTETTLSENCKMKHAHDTRLRHYFLSLSLFVVGSHLYELLMFDPRKS